MGSSYSAYIGPYLEVLEVPSEEVVRNFMLRTCTNKECKNHGIEIKTNFCGECSSEVSRMEVTKKSIEKINMWNIQDEYGDIDIFYIPELGKKTFCLPNAVPDSLQKYCIFIGEDSNGGEKEINEELMKGVDEFKNSYSNYLELLDKKEIKYKIKTGVVGYWS